LSQNKAITKEDAMGWLSIIGIYLVAGVLLALPFLLLQDKVLAWLISNAAGVTWLFWYGMQLGKSTGKHRWLFGALMAIVSILFLTGSYFIWT
jgi:VIT1/CCC1 family predicted Fe2+/Mn2+ transporter